MAFAYISSFFLTRAERAKLKAMFNEIDKNKDGEITEEEFKKAAMESSLLEGCKGVFEAKTPDELWEIISNADYNNDGVISWSGIYPTPLDTFSNLDRVPDGYLRQDE